MLVAVAVQLERVVPFERRSMSPPAGSLITGWNVVQGNVDLTNTCCYGPGPNNLNPSSGGWQTFSQNFTAISDLTLLTLIDTRVLSTRASISMTFRRSPVPLPVLDCPV